MSAQVVDGIKRTPKLANILEVLLQDQPEMTGLRICQAAGLGPGMIYPELARLERHEWVTSEWGPGEEPRPRFYWLTPFGRTRALALLGRYGDPE